MAALDVTARGFYADRQWMLVDPRGHFLTQRQLPRMTLIKTRLTEAHLTLSAPGMRDFTVGIDSPGPPDQDAPVRVQVWRDHCEAGPVGHDADHWLSDFLETDCRLVRMPEQTQRQVDMAYARKGDQVGFADGFPFLLISQASLDGLNDRLPADETLPIERFRPNLVISGCEPHEEDRWSRIRIGTLEFRLVKPCSRCTIPTINPETAEKSPEPLRTLAQYRRRDNQVYFGQNLIHEGTGRLEEGMSVEVLQFSEWLDV